MNIDSLKISIHTMKEVAKSNTQLFMRNSENHNFLDWMLISCIVCIYISILCPIQDGFICLGWRCFEQCNKRFCFKLVHPKKKLLCLRSMSHALCVVFQKPSVKFYSEFYLARFVSILLWHCCLYCLSFPIRKSICSQRNYHQNNVFHKQNTYNTFC